MTLKQNSSLGIVFILGLLAMLMPLSIDMYLPALPVIAAQYNVPDGSAQMTLSTYILGFAPGSAAVRPDGGQPWPQAGDPRRDAGLRRGGGSLRPVANRRYADCHAFLPRSGSRGGQRGD
ncbi:MFS family multidrug transport protein [Klebsiella pneumoniae]|uniref:MFS family multidrug transport protein n=1 Tax=Klebsiella pneumoniae TaxID=573 RepID=A0A378APT9_KLEPN|nr:MFS family multidrug transport protein [Klebsiella pneumoniae]